MAESVRQKYARALLVKREAEAALNAAKKQIEELEQPLRESFIEEGEDKVRVTVEALDVEGEVVRIAAELISTAPETADVTDIAEMLSTRLRRAELLIDSKPERRVSLSLGSRIWVYPVARDGEKADDDDYEAACDALETYGYGQYVQTRFNIISVSSAVKNALEAGELERPEGDPESWEIFDGKLRVVDKPQINNRVTAK